MELKPRNKKPTTPLYALVGAGDTVVKAVRGVPAPRTPKAPSRDEAVSAVQSVGTSVASSVKALPDQAQAAVSATVDAAVEAYGDLADRGRRLVGRVRRQQATQDLESSARTTVSRAKAASTTATTGATRTRRSAQKATRTARKSAESTTRTARKSTARTRTATKSATTSARKTAKAATSATSAAAQKVGT